MVEPAFMNRQTGRRVLLLLWPACRITNELQTVWSVQVTGESPSPAGLSFRPVYTAGYIPDISPQFNLDSSMLN